MERLTHKAKYEAGYKLNKGIKEWQAVDRVAGYENTGLTSEQILEMDRLYTEKCREVAELRQRDTPKTVQSIRKEDDSRMKEKPPMFKEYESTQAIDYDDGSGEIKRIRYADWICPTCGWFVGERYIPRMRSQRKSNFCSRCGQAIDWTKISQEEREAAKKRMEELRIKFFPQMEEWDNE